jgi:hypothetical protein
MTTSEDLLGRRPAMRPIPEAESVEDYQRPVSGDRMVICVSRVGVGALTEGTGIGSNPVTVSAPPWMRKGPVGATEVRP